uniref:Uncharacterized protein n=1 Tax=Romanomermis culicivorax TaxID=13658 RepID=A0A915KDY8_ROMCU
MSDHNTKRFSHENNESNVHQVQLLCFFIPSFFAPASTSGSTTNGAFFVAAFLFVVGRRRSTRIKIGRYETGRFNFRIFQSFSVIFHGQTSVFVARKLNENVAVATAHDVNAAFRYDEAAKEFANVGRICRPRQMLQPNDYGHSFQKISLLILYILNKVYISV